MGGSSPSMVPTVVILAMFTGKTRHIATPLVFLRTLMYYKVPSQDCIVPLLGHGHVSHVQL